MFDVLPASKGRGHAPSGAIAAFNGGGIGLRVAQGVERLFGSFASAMGKAYIPLRPRVLLRRV